MRWLLPCCLFLSVALPAQEDFGWWNEQHDWDGVSPWSDYLTLSPAFMGPNALPVPELRNGLLQTHTSLQLAAEGHFSGGDDTQNAHLAVSIPLYSERVALEINYVPIERYRMTVATRDERAARDFDGEGTASGDVYLGTVIQLLRDHRALPDVLLSINLKTASGGKLSAARFTDTPGYYFDVSVGKSYALTDSLSLRPHLLAGFYAWQTFRDQYFQNDAFLYGGGVDLRWPRLTLTNALGGYSGYLDEGDQPLVYRLVLATDLPGRVDYVARLQVGLRDMPYTSVRVGGRVRLGK